ncbi:MAG: GMC family oxidoreductase [Steroidobacteraceae bacterium]|jgi:choline dehydrogenase-like flavoprotein
MILDVTDFSDGHVLQSDVCIVGAGAAGIAMALELIDSGIDVLLLESGGLGAEPDAQALYQGTVQNEQLHSPPDRYRQRRFGGTTTIWGGRCMPFDPIDFEARDYVPHSGWPFGIEELSPFYPKANRLVEAGAFAYTAEEAFDRPSRPMIAGWSPAHYTSNTLERFSCPTDFGTRYGHKLRAASNIRVVLHANVTGLHLNAAGTHLDSLSVRSLKGRSLSVRASRYVLAAGGLENARLLLANRDVHAQGIGNPHDVLGRYYMCHIAGTVGALKIDRPLDDVWHGYDMTDDGIYVRRRLALRPEVQRASGIGNFIVRLHHPRITDPAHRNAILSLLFLAKLIIPYEYGKRLHGGESADLQTWFRHMGNVASGPLDAAAFAWHMFTQRALAARKFPSIIIKSKANLFSLDFHSEQQPNPQSRVSLTGDRDALGMPRLKVDWRYTSGDVDTVSRAIALLSGDINETKVGRLDYDASQLEMEMTRYGAYGGHHLGTARMGTDPRSSVVNARCRVHGIDNLFLAGAATFPTSSQANPTLTLIALALRLANDLKEGRA